jgi:hypothetical protein
MYPVPHGPAAPYWYVGAGGICPVVGTPPGQAPPVAGGCDHSAAVHNATERGTATSSRCATIGRVIHGAFDQTAQRHVPTGTATGPVRHGHRPEMPCNC